MEKSNTSIIKTCRQTFMMGALLGMAVMTPAFGTTTIINDTFNVTSETTGFDLDNGINFGINPPTTRLTGTEAANLRYIQTATNKLASVYSINGDALQILANGGIGRFVLSSDGVTPHDFGPALGVASATPENPVVYDIRISMKNTATTAARFTFGLATEEGNVDMMDFAVQLYRAASGNTFYTMAKRFDTGSTGVPDFTLSSPKIGTTANNTAGVSFIPFLIRVTDAGAESDGNYNSRIQLSINNGSTWIYDTAWDTNDLPNGWRLDGAPRYFVFDQAGSTGDFYYDEFSVTLAPSRTKTWTGGANSNWENAGNWSEGAAPTTGDALIFNGTTRQTNNNNRNATNLASVTSITFNNGGFTLQQNALTISQAITNLSGTNTINNAVTINDETAIQVESGLLTLGGVIGGDGSIVKTGSGSLSLAGANTYGGATVVAEGSLFVNGSLAAESAVSAAAGTTLGGSGTVNGPLQVSGTISPGDGAGILTTGDQTWNTGVTYQWQLDTTGADKIVANSLDIQAASVTLVLEGLADWDETSATNWTIVQTAVGISNFDANNFVLVDNLSTATGDGRSFELTSDGNNLILSFTPGIQGVEIIGNQTAGLIQFQGAPNTSYKIEYTDSLSAPISWSELTTQISSGEGEVSYQDPADPRPASRFYRVVLEP